MSLQDPATVSSIAARLMRGHDVRMARIGILRSSWTPARQEESRMVPPFVDIVLDTKPSLAESEPPVAVDFLSRQIRESLSRESQVTVDGLGVFEEGADGLVFDADDRLRHSVNAEWGHLEPHDLPASSIPAAPPSIVEDEATMAEPTSPTQADKPDTVSEDAPAAEPETVSEPAPVVAPKPEWQDLADAGHPSQPPSQRPDRKGRRSASTARPERKPGLSGIPTWLMIAGALVPVLVVVLGVLLWPDTIDPDSGSDNTVPSDSLLSAVSGAEADSTIEGVENAAVRDSSMAAAVPDTSGRASVPATSPPTVNSSEITYALSRGLPGYTLILASGISEASAVNLARRYDDLALPYGVLTYPSESGTLNRLALGQWPTVAEADSMRTVLADRLPEGTWVKRLD